MYVYGNIEARSRDYCCIKYYIFREWVFVVLGIQHAMCMRGIVIVDCPALKYFSTFIS
jgi:hypothetical protein